MTETWTILKVLQWATEYFSHRGIETARLDVELLLAFALGQSRIQLYTQFDRPLEEAELKKIKALIQRRALREPLAYIRGVKEFFSLEFVVSPAVLIPRPETEILVEESLKLLGEMKNPEIMDVGTGTGCIGLVLAKHVSSAKIWAVDASEDALEIAAINVRKHGLEDRVHLFHWDLLNEPWKQTPEKFDLIVSNPPYVSLPELSHLAPEISYEPKMAIEAGEEGLEFYPHLLRFAASHLKPGGWLVFEMGAEQAERLKALSESQGFSEVTVVKDLAGKARVLKMQK